MAVLLPAQTGGPRGHTTRVASLRSGAAGGDRHRRTSRSRADTRKQRASKGTPEAGRRHRRHKNTVWRTTRAREASPSDPARTKGWCTTRAQEAGLSVSARQTPQTMNTRHRRPYSDGDNSEPTKQAEHRAGYNTKNENPNTPTQHAPPRGGPRINTAPPNRGEGAHTSTALTPAKQTT